MTVINHFRKVPALHTLSLSALALFLVAPLLSAEISFDGVGNADIGAAAYGRDFPAPGVSRVKGLADRLSGDAKPAEWTIMVFLNGKNNLAPFAVKDLNEMEMVGSTDKVNVVAEAGLISDYGATPWEGVRRFFIKKDYNVARVTSPVVEDLGRVDMGNYRSLVDFGRWAKEKYPAKKYMLIIWDHGSGWERDTPGRPGNKSISDDEETLHHLTTPEMGEALKEIGGVDVYGSDACLMQMAEVDYEIKDYVKYIAGSEETQPSDGYTYDTFLGALAANPSMSPEELGRKAVASYSDHYQNRRTYTQSLVKADSVSSLPGLLDAFTAAVIRAGEKDLARRARDGALKFDTPQHKDLYDFVKKVEAGTGSAEVKAAARTLMGFITSDLVLINRTYDDLSSPEDYSAAKGISIYLPSEPPANGYTELRWAGAARWTAFLTWINN